jgi:hypothetical protein
LERIATLKQQDETQLKSILQNGWILAYTRERLIFHPLNYTDYEESILQLEEELKEEKILELHLFNQEAEYRAIETRSKRYPSGVIETLVDFKEEESTVFSEKIFLNENLKRPGDNIISFPETGRITVLNHISYQTGEQENGMAYIDNYRLIEE